MIMIPTQDHEIDQQIINKNLKESWHWSRVSAIYSPMQSLLSNLMVACGTINNIEE
jgi:hypothetical protein